MSPDDLLIEAPESIWPGLMPCDLLPILSDDAGNWLCVRIAADGFASQIVQWFHGGGDWIPWGDRLADALVFDAVVDRLPGPRRRLAQPAENPKPKFDPLNDPFVSWAFEHQTKPIRELLAEQTGAQETAELMLGEHVAEVAVRCELVQSALYQPWTTQMTPKLAKSYGLDWKEVVQWMFDHDLVPNDAWTKMKGHIDFDRHHANAQNWDLALHHARQVSEIAPELEWPWDICGYATQRTGQLEHAIELYKIGASKSTFTDQSVRLNTHWVQDSKESGTAFAKFSAAQLQALAPEWVAESEYESLLIGNDINEIRNQVSKHWIKLAKLAAQESRDHTDALQCWTRAGWDLGAESIDSYGIIIDGVVESAKSAGQIAKGTIASVHRRCLKDRYGI